MAKAKTETTATKAKSTKVAKEKKVQEEVMASEVVVETTEVEATLEEAPTKAKKASKGAKAAKVEKEVVPNEIKLKSKKDIIDMFATRDGDTGSPEVQVAISTQKIFNLSDHLQENPKDNHSRRGLLKIIAKRRRIIHYLQETDNARYLELINKLGLKK